MLDDVIAFTRRSYKIKGGNCDERCVTTCIGLSACVVLLNGNLQLHANKLHC